MTGDGPAGVLLSIVVPCYNVGAAMLPLLQRISAQMADDCELVLVNDGSTDDTGATVRAFLSGHAGPGRITLSETPNGGAAKARALGLSLASGDFVYFCDSDDVMQPQFVATLRANLGQFPALDLLFFSSEIAVAEGGRLRRLGRKLEYHQRHVFDSGAALLEHNLRQHMHTAAVWTFVARRALLVESGASFTHRGAHEDHLFTLSALLRARLVLAVPDLLYTQTLRPGSLTNSAKNAAYVLDRIAAFNEADRLLHNGSVALRRLYDAESLDAILLMLRDNRRLLPAVLMQRVGLVYFGARLVPMLGLLWQRGQHYVRRRLGSPRRAGS